MIAALLATLVVVSPAASDSVSVIITPFDGSARVEWLAFHSLSTTSTSSGTGPETVMQATDGSAITYCARDRGTWLRLEISSKRGTRIAATGPCTAVVATKRGVSTSGVADPRGA